MLNQLKGLIKNIGLFAVATFSVKILSFLMVPLFTSILTTEQYANIDLMILVTQLITPVFSMSIFDAVIRFCMDNDYSKNEIFTVGCIITVISTMCLGVLIPAFRLFDVIRDNEIFFVLLYFSGVASTVISYFLRAIDKIKSIVINSVFSTAVNLILSVVFINQFDLAEKGYYSALIMSNVAGCAYMFISNKLWQNIRFENIKISLLKQMLKYSLPLTPNSICWWINSSINRILLNRFVSKNELGLYSASNKIPSMLSLVTNTFQQAWTLSSISIYEENKKNENKRTLFYEQVFIIYNLTLFLCSFIMITLSKMISLLLLRGDFFDGWVYIPMLIIGFYFNALNTFAGAILTAIKKTNTILYSSFVAAVINIICGLILVPSFGGQGAALSMVIGYFMMWLLRIYTLKKCTTFSVNILKSLFDYVVLSLTSIIYIYINNSHFILLILLVAFYINHRKHIMQLVRSFKNIKRQEAK